MDVRAAVAEAAGEPLKVETVQLDGPKDDEILVEIKSTGICHTDAFTLSGEDPEGLFPAILGHEGAGIVISVGEGVSKWGLRRFLVRGGLALHLCLFPMRILLTKPQTSIFAMVWEAWSNSPNQIFKNS